MRPAILWARSNGQQPWQVSMAATPPRKPCLLRATYAPGKERLARWKTAAGKGHVAAMLLGCQQPEALELVAGEML